MNWSDERYVRVYTRDTPGWVLLGWEGQCVLVMLLRKADRAGVVQTGNHGTRGLAALLQMPLDIVERGLAALVTDGCVERNETMLVIRNFLEAQEAKSSSTQRQREYRERARENARKGLPPGSQNTCVIYFIQSENGGHIKIGLTDDLAKRVAGLQSGRPDRLVVLASAQGTRHQERLVHDRFAALRERGEWFNSSPELLAFVRDVTANGPACWQTLNASRHVSGNAALHQTLHQTLARDAALQETRHETYPVTPSRTVPSRAVLVPSADADASAPNGIEPPLGDTSTTVAKPNRRTKALKAPADPEFQSDLAKWHAAACAVLELSTHEAPLDSSIIATFAATRKSYGNMQPILDSLAALVGDRYAKKWGLRNLAAKNTIIRGLTLAQQTQNRGGSTSLWSSRDRISEMADAIPGDVQSNERK